MTDKSLKDLGLENVEIVGKAKIKLKEIELPVEGKEEKREIKEDSILQNEEGVKEEAKENQNDFKDFIEISEEEEIVEEDNLREEDLLPELYIPEEGQESPTLRYLLQLNEANKGKIDPINPLYIGDGIDVELAMKEDLENLRLEKIYLDENLRYQHLGVLGTTGTGKTMLAIHIIMHDIKQGDNVLVLDPKGDPKIFSAILQAAIEAGRLHEVMFVSPTMPQFSNTINLLRYFQMPDELVDHIVAGVKAKEEFFINIAYEVSSVIISSLLLLNKVGEKRDITFKEVKKWCSHKDLQRLKEIISAYTTHKDDEIREWAEEIVLSLEQITNSPPDYFAKVSSSLRTVLTQLSTSTAGRLIGGAKENEFIRRIENGEGAILFCNTGSLLTRQTSHIFAKILLSMVQASVGRILNAGRSYDRPLSIHMDEGHNVLYRGIQELFNKARAARVKLHFYTQSFAQIEEAVGKEITKSIIDNVSTWVFMRINHEETAKQIAESTKEVVKKEKMLTFQEGHLMVTVREGKTTLITTDKILELPNRFFYLRKLGKYYKCRTPDVPPLWLELEYPWQSVVA